MILPCEKTFFPDVGKSCLRCGYAEGRFAIFMDEHAPVMCIGTSNDQLSECDMNLLAAC